MPSITKNLSSVVAHYSKRPAKDFLGFCLKGLRVVFHLRRHIRLSESLKFFVASGYVPSKISFIYLFKYVSKSFTARERADVLNTHYGLLRRKFSNVALHNIFRDGLSIWDDTIGNQKFNIVLGTPTPYEEEGSLALVFNANGRDIYSAAFSFSPGANFGYSEDLILFVSRIQGGVGRLQEISETSKIFSDNNPSTLLISAMEGLALSLGINKIVGISAENQIGYTPSHTNFQKSYNTFWETYESRRLSSGDYSMHVPLQYKELSLIKSRRRKRTMNKREIRQNISTEVHLTLAHLINKRLTVPVRRPEFVPEEGQWELMKSGTRVRVEVRR